MAENQPAAPTVAEAAAPGPVAAAATKVTETISNVGTTLGEGLTKGQETFAEMRSKYGMMILFGVLLAIILFFIAYALYIYLSGRLTNKLMVELPDSLVPRKGTQVTKLDGGALPPSTNGNRTTIMFWIYLHDINLLSGDELRHVLHRGDETLKGASPAVYLDGKKNRLYVRFAKDTDKTGPDAFSTQGPTDLPEQIKRIKDKHASDTEMVALLGASASITDTLDAIKVDLSTHGVVIDYVPLQRWVHVAIVVNETVNRGYISVYLDGEPVSSISSSDKILLSNGREMGVSFMGLNLNKKGDVYVGGDTYNANMPRGFSGLVSRVMFSNFDMSGPEIKDVYLRGPVDNLTSKLGLPAYGVRSPIYKIGA